jgi:SAM-dependent methyltransferase
MSVGAQYDGLAEWYDSQFPNPFSEAVRESVASLLGRGGGDCLDVGCGGGQYFETLAGLGWRVTGTDISEDQLVVARPRAEAVAADLVRCDATAMPFADASFDAVTAIMISTDVQPYEGVLAEAARVLRPDGRFVHVGVHPCFAGPHSRFIEGEHTRIVGAGYRERGFTKSSPAFHPEGIRIKTGAAHIPLDDLINGLVAAQLAITRVVECFRDPPVMLGLAARRTPPPT